MAAATEKEELAELDRVLTRLALTDEANLEKVVTRLLPLALERLGSPHQSSRNKVLEMLSHINKRVKDQAAIALPLPQLLALYQKPDAPPMVCNFALVYVEMAAQRASPEDRAAVVPQLLSGIAAKTSQHRDMLLRLAFAGLAPLGGSAAPRAGDKADEAAFAAQYLFLSSAADREAFLQFGLLHLLYAPALSSPPPSQQARLCQIGQMRRTATAAGQAPSAAAAANGDGQPQPAAKVAPPGSSLADIARVQGKAAPSGEELVLQRLGFLNFTAAAGIEATEVLRHYLVASCDSVDPKGRVAARGEALLRKRCGVDSQKPAVDLESPSVVQQLFKLFLGDNTSSGAAATETTVQPASPAVQARLMGLFTKSIAAANSFPQTLQVIFTCVYGATTTLRLKQAGMEFAVWVFKHASDAQLAPMAPATLQGLLRLLDSDSQALLRSFTYQAIGQLAGRAPKLFSGDTAIAGRFFDALVTEPPGVRAAVQEAVSSLAAAYKGCTGDAAAQIEKLLLDSITAPEEGRRLSAVQWAGKLFDFEHVPARYICVLAAGDRKLEVKEAGAQGLLPPKPNSASGAAAALSSSTEEAKFPATSEVIAYFGRRHPRLGRAADAAAELPLSAGAFAALVGFLRACWKAEAAGTAAAEGTLTAYAGLLEHALGRDATPALQVSALTALLQAAGENPTALAQRYAGRLPWLRGFLSHTDAAAREAAAKLLGITALAQPGPAMADLLADLSTIFLTPMDAKKKAARFEDRDGATAASGYVLAQAAKGQPAVPGAAQAASAESLHAALKDKDSVLAAAAAAALGHAGLRSRLLLPGGFASAAQSATQQLAGAATSSAATTAAGSAAAPTATAADTAAGAASPMDSENAAAVPVATGKPTAAAAAATRSSAVEQIVALTKDRDNKVVVRAATALGHLAAGDPTPQLLDAVVEGLFALSANKAEEVQFAAGEALCFVFGGVPVSADIILRSDYRGLAAWLTATTAESTAAVPAAAAGPTDMAVDPAPGAPASAAADAEGTSAAAAGGQQQEAGSGGEAREAARQRILTKLLDELIFHSRTEVRAAACVWLLALVSYTGRNKSLQPRLQEIQEAFSGLLGDGNELTQEMAARGISVVYSLSDGAARKQLLDGLVGVLQGGTRKRRAVKVEGDSRIFAEGAMPSAPGGGSLSTYRELCGLANDLGQPDLVYRFMDLANHAAALNSSRGAAVGFAAIAKLAGEQLAPYVAVMVPKLYRYQYDPNPKVRDAMSAIWRALVPEPRAAIEQHWDAIAGELLSEIGGRLWRNREAACLGLAELLQGRRWPNVQARFEEMWGMALRALDDIKDSVRAAAVTLARALRGLTLRVADVQQSSPADAAAAVSIALPLLLEKGLGSPVAEVAGLAVDTVAQIVKSAGPVAVRPHLPLLIGALLESLSTLEDSRLNYIEQHAERLGMDAGRLEGARFSAARASPMGDALDTASRYVDAASLEALVPKLGQLVKRGVGVNTRVGAARFISGLALRMASDIRPSSGALIKALLGAARTEQSGTAQKSIAAAIAAVARYAPDSKVEKLLGEAVTMHAEPGDTAARKLAGLLCREVARSASEAFAKHAGQVLPLAFVAKSDEEADVATLWAETWEEATSGATASLRLYIGEIVPLITADLASQQWGRKRCAAAATAAAAEASPDAIAPHAAALASALQAELPGRLWDGKEALLPALAAVAEAAPAALGREGAAAAIAALTEAAGRKKTEYRKAALTALRKTLAALPDQDHFAAAGPLLLATLAAHAQRQNAATGSATASSAPAQQPTVATSTSAAAAGSSSAGSADAEAAPAPALETVAALAAAWEGVTSETAAANGAAVAEALLAAMLQGHAWNVRAEALGVVKAYIRKLARLAASDGGAMKAGTGAQQLSDQQLPWAAQLVPGILAATEEARVSQVRAAAVDALKALLAASNNGATLPPDVLAQISQRLQALASSERNSAIAAQVASIRSSMPS